MSISKSGGMRVFGMLGKAEVAKFESGTEMVLASMMLLSLHSGSMLSANSTVLLEVSGSFASGKLQACLIDRLLYMSVSQFVRQQEAVP